MKYLKYTTVVILLLFFIFNMVSCDAEKSYQTKMEQWRNYNYDMELIYKKYDDLGLQTLKDEIVKNPYDKEIARKLIGLNEEKLNEVKSVKVPSFCKDFYNVQVAFIESNIKYYNYFLEDYDKNQDKILAQMSLEDLYESAWYGALFKIYEMFNNEARKLDFPIPFPEVED